MRAPALDFRFGKLERLAGDGDDRTATVRAIENVVGYTQSAGSLANGQEGRLRW